MVSVGNEQSNGSVATATRRVVVTGASGLVGRAVLRACSADPSIGRVVAVDLREPDTRPAGVETRTADILTVDLDECFAGADVVIHLASIVDPIIDDTLAAQVNVVGTRRVLDAAARAGVTRVVRLASAAVYGAWPTNPTPLTEDAPLRPVPGHATAVQAAEVERALIDWRADHPEVTVTTLRVAPVVGRGADHVWARVLAGPRRLRVRGAANPVQVVHPDDVARAVLLAASTDLTGAYNVAADGALGPDEVDALLGRASIPALPAELLTRLLARAFASGAVAVPPSVVPYLEHPWVVATDRLAAAGWRPQVANEEAILEVLDGRPDATGVPRWAIGALVGSLVAAGLVALVRGLRRR
jgi:UDP-glucose 4-epimerase